MIHFKVKIGLRLPLHLRPEGEIIRIQGDQLDMEKNNSRRVFLRALVFGVGAIALSPVIRLKNALGGELAKPTDPLVKALGYVENVGKLKGALAPKDHKKGTKCSNCQFYGDTTGKAPQAKCQLITSGEVLGTGWCRSYSQRPGAKV